MKSFLSIGLQDVLKGFAVAVVAAVFAALLPILQTGGFPDWNTLKGILFTALAAGIAYLVKNLFTNSNGNLLKTEKAIPVEVKVLNIKKAAVEANIKAVEDAKP